jgi:hypothetical protein
LYEIIVQIYVFPLLGSGHGDVSGKVKGVRSVKSYSDEEQALVYLMRVSIQHTYTVRAPWVVDEDDIIERAKEFAKGFTTGQVDDMVAEDFAKTVSSIPRFAPLYLESNTLTWS